MGRLKKIVVIMLGSLLMLRLTFQMCCHKDWSELFAHEHTTSNSHTHSKKSSDSDCGTHQLKDLFKPNTVSVTTSQSVSSFDIFFDENRLFDVPQISKNHSFRLVFFNKAGPPIYLLNNVFLN